MQNEPFTHKLADSLHQAWPFLSGLGIIMMATVKLWWNDRRDIKQEIDEVRKLNLWLKANSITHTELAECREDVRKADHANMESISSELKGIRTDIDAKHSEVMSHIVKLAGDKK